MEKNRRFQLLSVGEMLKVFLLSLPFLLPHFFVSCSEKKDIGGRAFHQGRFRLLSHYETRIDYVPWPENVIADEELIGEGGSFAYWWEHRTDADREADLHDLCELPEGQLSQMSTRNLARTCYLYPYNLDMMAYDDEYFGLFRVLGRFNGHRELMRRRSGAAELLHLYQELHYPKVLGEFYMPLDYMEYLNEYHGFVGIGPLTMMLMAAVDYGCFFNHEIETLVAEVKDKINDVLDDPNGIYSYVGDFRYPYVLGGIIAYHYDTALSSKDVEMLKSYIAVVGFPLKQDGGRGAFILDSDAIFAATQIIIGSLNRLGK